MKRSTIIVYTKRKILILALISAISCGLTLGRAALKVFVRFPPVLSGQIIVIDPGHGGLDGGAVGITGFVEKDMTLDIGLRLKRLFNRHGVYVVMTREGDYDLVEGNISGPSSRKRRDLNQRVQIINKSGAVLFLSIHGNSFPESIWSGAQTFYTPGNEESRKLAEHIQGQLVADLGPNKRKAKPAEFYLLENSKVPGVLVEVGFLSNPREESLLKDQAYREKVAESIRKGTERYLLEKAQVREEKPVISQEIASREPIEDGFILLYFVNPSNLNGELAPEVRKITPSPDNTQLARTIISELLKGPNDKSILMPSLISEARIKSVYASGSTIYVDFDGASVDGYKGGSIRELLTVYSIVNSLLQLPGMERVQFSIDGERNSTLGGHIFFDEPFEKDMSMVRFDK
jgi:N-acetylmuramoyl-L-alanine amidase